MENQELKIFYDFSGQREENSFIFDLTFLFIVNIFVNVIYSNK